MRIAFVTRGPFGVIGGAASYMLPTVASLRNDVLVCAPHSPASKEKVVFKNSEIDIVNIFSASNSRLVLNLYSELRRFKPDIVHVFQSPKCLLYFSELRSLFPKTKWILDIRTQIITDDSVQRRRMLGKFFFSQFYVDHIFSQSIHTISSSLPVRLKKFSELPIGLSINDFVARENPPQSVSRFIFVGLLAKQREIDILIKAFGEFSAKTDKAVSLDLIGDGNDAAELKRLCQDQGFDNIKFLGVMEQRKIAETLHRYDAGIAYVPYEKYMWAPSLKSLEYAASGLPILASDTEGHKDYSERFGFTFNYFSNDHRGIVSGIESIVEKTGFKKERSDNLSAVRRFDWEHIFNSDVLPVYNKLN